MGISNIERNHENGFVLFELRADGVEIAHLVPVSKTRGLGQALEGLIAGEGAVAGSAENVQFEAKFHDFTSSALAAEAGSMAIAAMPSGKGGRVAHMDMDMDWEVPIDGKARARLMDTHGAGVVGAVRAILESELWSGKEGALAVAEILCAYEELANKAGHATQARMDGSGYGIGQKGLPHAKALQEAVAMAADTPEAPKKPSRSI